MCVDPGQWEADRNCSLVLSSLLKCLAGSLYLRTLDAPCFPSLCGQAGVGAEERKHTITQISVHSLDGDESLGSPQGVQG